MKNGNDGRFRHTIQVRLSWEEHQEGLRLASKLTDGNFSELVRQLLKEKLEKTEFTD